MGKTGGGRGTNQYALRGVSQVQHQDAAVLEGLSRDQESPQGTRPAPVAERRSLVSRVVMHPPINFGQPCTSLRRSGRPCRHSVRGQGVRCPRCYEELSRSPEIWQRALLARDPAPLPEQVAWRLARDPVAAVAAEVAKRHDISDEMRAYLASSPHRLVQKTLQRSETASASSS